MRAHTAPPAGRRCACCAPGSMPQCPVPLAPSPSPPTSRPSRSSPSASGPCAPGAHALAGA
eukprot:5188371-Pleurochrysis_carterae.AAC.1